MEGIKAEPRPLDIRSSIAEACTLMEEAAELKQINLQNRLDDAVYVSADHDQIQLILRNLIHNAIKFSKPNQQISISAVREVDVCTVSIKDNGIGMSQNEIETILSAREHFSKVGTMKEKGTGLGLLLCQEFIKLNGGSLKIRSGSNSGTEVSFTLPLAEEHLN